MKASTNTFMKLPMFTWLKRTEHDFKQFLQKKTPKNVTTNDVDYKRGLKGYQDCNENGRIRVSLFIFHPVFC